MVAALSASMVLQTSNIEENRKLWDLYADDWSPSTPWVASMAAGTHAAYPAEGSPDGVEDETKKASAALSCVGDEWSLPAHLDQVVSDFVVPYVDAASTHAAEIGSGGGRVAQRVAPMVEHLRCFDISPRMLSRCRQALSAQDNVSFSLIQSNGPPIFKAELHSTFDFIYAFDVFVHVDLHTLREYLIRIHELLRPGGKCFFSAANVLSPEGWRRFSAQGRASVAGFCWTSPDIVRCLIVNAGLRIVKEAEIDERNVYYNRDYLVLVEKPAE